MIYLIQSAGYDDSGIYIDLLKIGFTEDSISERRFLTYKLHNPTFKLLVTIPDGGKIHESMLHYKFNSFKYLKYGNEWFTYSEEIIDYFTGITLEEINNLPLPIHWSNKLETLSRNILSKCLRYKQSLSNQFYGNYIDMHMSNLSLRGIRSELDIINYIKELEGEDFVNDCNLLGNDLAENLLSERILETFGNSVCLIKKEITRRLNLLTAEFKLNKRLVLGDLERYFKLDKITIDGKVAYRFSSKIDNSD